jgi:hypothetical protein
MQRQINLGPAPKRTKQEILESHAEECSRRAELATDSLIRYDFLDLAAQWLELVALHQVLEARRKEVNGSYRPSGRAQPEILIKREAWRRGQRAAFERAMRGGAGDDACRSGRYGERGHRRGRARSILCCQPRGHNAAPCCRHAGRLCRGSGRLQDRGRLAGVRLSYAYWPTHPHRRRGHRPALDTVAQHGGKIRLSRLLELPDTHGGENWQLRHLFEVPSRSCCC